jgi:hypothetical protein
MIVRQFSDVLPLLYARSIGHDDKWHFFKISQCEIARIFPFIALMQPARISHEICIYFRLYGEIFEAILET